MQKEVIDSFSENHKENAYEKLFGIPNGIENDIAIFIVREGEEVEAIHKFLLSEDRHRHGFIHFESHFSFFLTCNQGSTYMKKIWRGEDDSDRKGIPMDQ